MLLLFFKSLLTFFKLTFTKNSLLIWMLSERQTVWIQNMTDILVVPDLGPNCLKRLSAEGKITASKERVDNLVFYV